MSITMDRTNHPESHRVAERKRRLEGSVALITGGGRGVGQLVARSLADAGATVALVARSIEELAHTVELISAAGGTAAAAVADVTESTGFAAAVADLRDQVGPYDLLVNNAGILGPVGPLWELDLDDWWTTMNVNLRGLIVGTQLVIPDMVAAGRGRIINVTSEAGIHRWPLASAYSVSKAAVIKLTENLALEKRATPRHHRAQRPSRLPDRDDGNRRRRGPDNSSSSMHPGLGTERPHRGTRSRTITRVGPADPARGRRCRWPHWPAPLRPRRSRCRALPPSRGS